VRARQLQKRRANVNAAVILNWMISINVIIIDLVSVISTSAISFDSDFVLILGVIFSNHR